MGLNQNQKRAVEYLEGPLLVLAGPGTGKTQLLSEKVAYILKNTDTAPENILCLTFTESGASNMRERLKGMIGREASKVNIGTYHAFGQDILAQYKNYSPEYTRVLDAAIDEVTQFKIVKELQSKLPARDILLGDKVRDIVSVISEAKAAGLTASDLALIAKQNIEDSEVLSSAISPLLLNVVPRVYKTSLEKAYQPIYQILKDYETLDPIVGRIERSIASMARDLRDALNEATALEKISPLSSWKDTYFEKDGKGGYRLADRVANRKLASVAVIMDGYQKYLEENGLYDFDDMIIEAMKILNSDDGFRETMQEKYQFVMLDEFQDTNPTQLSIVKQLTDYEKPMIMAVGDDDQAIYEFQGATPTNLFEFQQHYGAEVIALTENYRSTQEILDYAKNIIDQAPNRFVNEKILTAHLPEPKESQIHRLEFLSSDQEYSFIADKIAELVKSRVKQSDIAIISNKHKYFTPLLPYLKSHPEIKIAYERRDNLLDDSLIHEMLTVMKLALEVAKGERPTVSMLEVLSYSWLGVPVMEAVKVVAEARAAHKPVFEYLLNAEGISEKLQAAMEFLANLVAVVLSLPLENVFAILTEKMEIKNLPAYEMFRFYENLASIRSKLARHAGDKALRTSDLIEMVEDYEAADMQIVATSPYRDADEAVQVLSAHKAKGLEFSYVFIVSADHTAWGKGKGNNNFLVLPKNLMQIRHTGTTDGEKLRVLYVALTRAKHTLYITNSLHDFNGKSPERLEYFDEHTEKLEDGSEVIAAPFLPTKFVVPQYGEAALRGLLSDGDDNAASAKLIDGLKNYLSPYLVNTPDMRAIYKERVKNYRMSASSLTSFIDIVNAGPEEFFRQKVLRSEIEPEDENMAIGNLVHATFEQVTNSGMSDSAAMEFYLAELEKKDLPQEVKARIREAGPKELEVALREFSRILRQGKAEVDLSYEHLVIGGVPVTGKIDHIIIDDDNKTIEIYDFKTGKYHKEKWGSHATLYKYSLQLMFYKLLLNHSPVYSKYRIERGHILFVRPDDDGEVYDKVYEFEPEAEMELLSLMQAVYEQITDLRFLDDPEIMRPADKSLGLKDIKEFIALLLAKNEEK
ncbi:MAG: ATP-dependent DNA helicase [Candidatus Saccharibacteria bacterium]|nr:ATP-dependent DNA helicase [Candidatus Saccharibacteria bacterium]